MAGRVNFTFIAAVVPLVFALVCSASDNKSLEIDCQTQTGVKKVTVVQPETVVTIKCPTSAKNVKPAFQSKAFQVCTTKTCTTQVQLTSLCKDATAEVKNAQTAAITINTLPPAQEEFFIMCDGSGGKNESNSCIAQVVVEQSKESGGAGPQGPAGTGTPVVQSCAQAGTSITLKLQEQGETVQFTCGELTLLPSAEGKVFADDCTKQEDLKDMSLSLRDKTYSLNAIKKPPKKKLCYLCATPGAVGEKAKSRAPTEYCAVYIESSARTQLGSSLTWALILPCVLTVLCFT